MALCPAPDPTTRAQKADGLVPLASPLPEWIPDLAETYLTHVNCGVPLRRIAHAKGVHASTVLRQVRKLELRRDDPLMDEALTHIAHVYFTVPTPPSKGNVAHATIQNDPCRGAPDQPRSAAYFA